MAKVPALWPYAAAALTALHVAPPRASAAWTAPAPLNAPDDVPRVVTFPRLAASMNGGFHAVYQAWDDAPAPRAEHLRYRRVHPTGALAAPLTIQKPANGANRPEVAEAPNGDAHLVWESWAGGGPEVGWARSTNNGQSFAPGVEITRTGRHAQDVQAAGFGLGGSAGAVATWRNNTDNSIEYASSSGGSSWSGLAWTGEFSRESASSGIARSPVDGSVRKLFDVGAGAAFRRFNGSGFGGPSAPVMSDVDQYREASLATNAAGQTMVLIDHDYVAKAQLVNADGTRGVFDGDLFGGRRNFGTVTAIPGTNDFFAVATDATRAAANRSTHIFGRKFAGGQWGPLQTLATMGGPPDLIQNVDVAADAWGNLMVSWQYNLINPDPQPGQTPWRPNAYYSLLLDGLPGDANADGRVDVTDLGILATHFNGAGFLPQGDFNADGTVDVGDLGILATNFGRARGTNVLAELPAADRAALASFAASVPEPGSVGVLGLTAATLLPRRSRRRSLTLAVRPIVR